ncbi:MAG: helix-hairpin-helix domain-containing protein [Bryobacteraceae bacterium]|jgi:DNA uptake protein ComE-like DNA-binding protein
MRFPGFVGAVVVGSLLAASLTMGCLAAAAASKPLKADSVSVAELVDINKATAAELKTLPGIADAYAAAIIAGRPYRNKTQLRSKGVIPLAAYKRIEDKIIARQ